MIEPKELRLGNIVDCEQLGGWGIVTEIGAKSFKVKGFGLGLLYDRNDPIPLTKEILLKCGFTIGGEGGILNQDLLGISLPIDSAVNGILQDKSGNIVIVGSEFKYTEPKIEYLHQLQNFWFTNTNQELPIKDL